MRSTLGPSATWMLRPFTELYSFSSGALLGLGPEESLLMARSSEQPENSWLSWEDSLPGLLSSGPEPQLSELPSAHDALPPAGAPVGTGDTGVSSAGLLLLLMGGALLAGTLLGTELVGILWSGTKPAGTLGGAVPARVVLIGSLDGGRLVGTLVGGFEQVGKLEGTVLVNAEWVGTLEGAMLVVVELVGTPTPLEQTVASAWPPAPPAEEGEVAVDRADTAGPGKRLALGVERARGWKDTVGDTGP